MQGIKIMDNVKNTLYVSLLDMEYSKVNKPRIGRDTRVSLVSKQGLVYVSSKANIII